MFCVTVEGVFRSSSVRSVQQKGVQCSRWGSFFNLLQEYVFCAAEVCFCVA